MLGHGHRTTLAPRRIPDGSRSPLDRVGLLTFAYTFSCLRNGISVACSRDLSNCLPFARMVSDGLHSGIMVPCLGVLVQDDVMAIDWRL
jgi:hypothetical protein